MTTESSTFCVQIVHHGTVETLCSRDPCELRGQQKLSKYCLGTCSLLAANQQPFQMKSNTEQQRQHTHTLSCNGRQTRETIEREKTGAAKKPRTLSRTIKCVHHFGRADPISSCCLYFVYKQIIVFRFVRVCLHARSTTNTVMLKYDNHLTRHCAAFANVSRLSKTVF